jgi:hypothetical protein
MTSEIDYFIEEEEAALDGHEMNEHEVGQSCEGCRDYDPDMPTDPHEIDFYLHGWED